MSELSLRVVRHGPLRAVSADFSNGIHCVLGHERDGTAALLRVCTGLARPTRGSLTLGGVPPFSAPHMRRRIASLLADDEMAPAETVLGSLSFAMSFWPRTTAPVECLTAAGLGALAARAPATLTRLEHRALSLLLALSHPEPELVALFDPFEPAALLPLGFLEHALERARASGAVVLLTTGSPERALRLGGRLHVLERGQMRPGDARRHALGLPALRVRSVEAERLFARLSASPLVSVTRVGAGDLLVRAEDLAQAASVVFNEARASGAHIAALRCELWAPGSTGVA